MTLNLMNFRRNSQNLTLLKTNNVGDDLRKEINASSSLNSVLGAGILLPDKPAVSDLYAYRNDSYSASINQLYKLDKDRTLSFNVNYLYDQEKQNATDESRYLLDDGTRYVIQESNHALVGQHFVGQLSGVGGGADDRKITGTEGQSGLPGLQERIYVHGYIRLGQILPV